MSVPGPRIERSLTIRFRGDWGQANMHRICGWLAQELGDRCAPGTERVIWSGRGCVDNLNAVANGDVDIAVVTPAQFAAMAVAGVGLYSDRPLTRLRALGHVRHDDALLLAVRADLGVSSVDELRELGAPIRLATAIDDGVNHIGFAARQLLAAAGIAPGAIEGWGGVLESERPPQSLEQVRLGQASAVLQEAIMTRDWERTAEAVSLRYLSFPLEALELLEQRFGWAQRVIPAGYLPGMASDVTTLDFSGFLIVARDDLPDDLAGLAAWCLVNTCDVLERWYGHLPAGRSPIKCPVDPREIAVAPIELHPGAARRYSELLPERMPVGVGA
jgi:uncharacterized protein